MSTVKSITIVCIFMISMFSVPITDYTRATGDPNYGDQIDTPQEGEELAFILGDMFSTFREFGASGEMFAEVFQLMFSNFENMSSTESDVKGMYVLNASIITDKSSTTIDYGENDESVYYPWGIYNLENATNPDDQDESPYFVLKRNGTLTYNTTEGASLTFIIWDDDGSFIKALDNVINTVKTFMEIESKMDSGEINDEQAQAQAISAMVEAITYFLIHINDIITGDEVIILNIIGFTNYYSSFNGTVEGTWYVTENGAQTNNRTLNDAYPDWHSQYNHIANLYQDDYMLYLLSEGYNETNADREYTQFSFDLIELWLKEFQVSIDAEAILGAIAGEEGRQYFHEKTATEIFQELKLEFYIFTHHFQNYYLFDDQKFNSPIYSAEDQQKANNGVPDVIWENVTEYEGDMVERVSDTEIEYYLLFKNAADWKFDEPQFNTDEGSVNWGITIDDLDFRVLPLGMQDDQVNSTVAPIENMDFLKLGFEFKPTKREKVDTSGFEYVNAKGEVTMGSAKVKLLQSFGLWKRDTDGKPFTPTLKDHSYQLATVFLSTIFHFKLWIENRQITEGAEQPAQALLNESNYNRETSKVKVGNAEGNLPLAEIDIAGPDYEKTTPDDVTTTHPAKTTTIPTVYAEWEGKNSETYTQEDNSTARINSTVNFDFSLLLYAVSYDAFSSSGDQIIHDPTFSIFIVSENPGFWAVILVVGSVSLVGVAAFLITRRKNA
ncbi:MAG: hypothetical protein K9W44_00965 [Candidatus Lokiarchaeota archaeon]|nr:hypothetical protein [Candidatus Harpocratesius repetitus]